MMQARLRFHELSPTMGADVVGLDLAAVVAAGGAVPAARRSAGFRAMLEPGPVPGLSPGEWHRTTLTLRGDRASIEIDGAAPVAGGVGLPARGRLALVPGPPGTEYANIFVKPLD